MAFLLERIVVAHPADLYKLRYLHFDRLPAPLRLDQLSFHLDRTTCHDVAHHVRIIDQLRTRNQLQSCETGAIAELKE